MKKITIDDIEEALCLDHDWPAALTTLARYAKPDAALAEHDLTTLGCNRFDIEKIRSATEKRSAA